MSPNIDSLQLQGHVLKDLSINNILLRTIITVFCERSCECEMKANESQ